MNDFQFISETEIREKLYKYFETFISRNVIDDYIHDTQQEYNEAALFPISILYGRINIEAIHISYKGNIQTKEPIEMILSFNENSDISHPVSSQIGYLQTTSNISRFYEWIFNNPNFFTSFQSTLFLYEQFRSKTIQTPWTDTLLFPLGVILFFHVIWKRQYTFPIYEYITQCWDVRILEIYLPNIECVTIHPTTMFPLSVLSIKEPIDSLLYDELSCQWESPWRNNPLIIQYLKLIDVDTENMTDDDIKVPIGILCIIHLLYNREPMAQGTHGSPAIAGTIEAKPRGTLSNPPFT